MKISMFLDYSDGVRKGAADVAEYEKAGLDMVWVAEAYGHDAPSLMGYLAALTHTVEIASGILPIYSRTPSLLAMTAAGLDSLTEGRFNLGLGSSGPQVVEGWHGIPFTGPVGRTRETIDICRKIWRREAPLTHEGTHYSIPLAAGGTGLGKPLKIIVHPVRPVIPIWIAALGEKNVAMAAELADGWVPFLFVPERARDVWGTSLDVGTRKRDPSLQALRITSGGLLAIGEGEEVIKVRERYRPMVALYVGGMGAKGKNFYNDVAKRYGFEQEAEDIQNLYLAGKKKEAEARVPEELLELTSLCGPESYVAERIAAFREAGVTDLQVAPVPVGDQRPVDLIAQIRDLTG